MTSLDCLPQDILLLILQYLEAYDLRRLQLVSHSLRQTFSENIYLRTILKSYPHAREVRYLLHEDKHALSSHKEDHPNTSNFQHTLNTIATRYHHLTCAKPRCIQRVTLRALDQSGHWLPTPQWDYHESQPGGRLYHEHASHLSIRSVNGVSKPYLLRPTLWTYDDGLLVYAPATTAGNPNKLEEIRNKEGAERGSQGVGQDRCLVVLDLESGEEAEVPFDVRGNVIRNIRLKEGVLIVEWAEKEAFHDLNMLDKVHRHFATAFHVTRTTCLSSTNLSEPGSPAIPAGSNAMTRLSVTFRSEWRIHFLGFPLTSRDYFFSTHTARHYCLYYWQPNRSLWTGDEDQPIEALHVWDISMPNPYQPSEDPGNAKRQYYGKDGPKVVAKFAMTMLEFLGIRQQSRISLLGFGIDSENCTVSIRENVFESGQGYFDPAERNWLATVTTIPFIGQGPVQRREGHIELPSYRGHASMESDEIDLVEKWFLPIMDCFDASADVRYSLVETCFTGMMGVNRRMVRIKVLGELADLAEEVAREVGAMGRIAGDERWLIGQNEELQVVVAKFQ